jgi:protein arginine kinase
MAGKYARNEINESIVISIRIRLARNFAGFPFPRQMDEAQAVDVVELVDVGLKKLDTFQRYDIKQISEQDAALLQEQRLISPALLSSKYGSAFISQDEGNVISIMVNEEDHLREQYIYKGFDFLKAYERISAVDDGLGSIFDFAFDEKLGYLTACPSNLGTGMRASVMMFLPGLVWNGGLKKLLTKLRAEGITVRGAFGEGTKAEGYVYQISNERTLGLSEIELLTQMDEVCKRICELERAARDEMLVKAEMEIKDRCMRAYGALSYCEILSLKEFVEKIGDVKLGVIFGFLEADGFDEIHDFIEGMHPTTFRYNNGIQYAGETDCNIVRAETVRKVLPRIVQVAK